MATETPDLTPFDTLTLADLRRRTSVKWRAYAPDVLPLFVAEMDVTLAPQVVDAVHRAMQDGDTGYDHGTGYAEALAGFAAPRWGWEIDVARTRTLADVMVGLTEVIGVLTGPGDAVVVNPPVYPPFYSFPGNAGRRIVEAPLADGRIDLDALEAAFADATGVAAHGDGPGSGRRAVYLLCNPHNPTGTAHTRAELEAALALAARYGVRVVADEIHAPLAGHLATDGPRFTPLLSVDGSDDAITVLSASKAWNLAGLKTAVAVAGPGAAHDLRRIPEIANHGVSHLAAVAHAAALRDAVPWLDAVLRGIDRNKELFADLVEIHLPGAVHRPAEATYFGWVDCRGLDLGAAGGRTPSRYFLDEARVAVNEGATFGEAGRGHVRVNLATSPAILTEAVERMGAALAR
ncbi:cystathionine beta-lyase [Sediminihabitans luteus]|uniref:cysteine-S-conjugate beta-lyase n=1 Tax=Sediminihabitans luteus TaxID=1138585 RepID=A0A2M9D0R6_9CELL|nr:aminotransferase class I/II-fold pyridoxal phosphate-dependent enzyme [Sediminihabitans luteus]PJJ77786.1 cystathionine beta-lyase [Sediminihabitans luteus]GII99856.1 cystathionine beta-lyase [Sediminihabitans luteus]